MEEIFELVESEIKKPSVFLDESKLYPEYIPSKLPHRENQIKQLSRLFKMLVLSPGSTSIRAILVGRVGTGKTVTATVFGRTLTELAKRKGIELRYVHVNCSKNKNAPSIMREIKNQLGLSIPDRGLSAPEIAQGIIRELERQDAYVLVTLDEFDYFLTVAKPDDRYFVVRIYDVFKEKVKRLNFIYISRASLERLSGMLDELTSTYLLKNVVNFTPYTSRELFDILKDRADKAFMPGTIDDDILEYIAEIEGHDMGGEGNARKAIAILLAAGKLADRDLREGRASRVTLEHVRAALAHADATIISVLDMLPYLNLHQLLVLKAIALSLKESGESYVSMGIVERAYRRLCREVEEEPRKHTKLYEYVMDLKRRGVIVTKKSVKGVRGRSTYMSFGAAPLDPLISRLDELIKLKLA